MGNEQMHSIGLRGLSFSIADLLLIGAWSAARGQAMVVQARSWVGDRRI